MAKIKVIIKNSQVNVKTKLDKTECINERELGVIQKKLIRGFMRPTVEKDNKITYLAPLSVSLNKYLQTGLSKGDFFLLFAQIVEVIKRIERNSLNVNNLVLNLKYVFINEKTKEVHFIYQPIGSLKISTNLFSFLYDVIYQTNLKIDEDNRFLNELRSYLQSLEIFSTERIEGYILKVYPEVYKQIHREKPGQSQVLKEKKYYDEDDTDILDEDDTGLLSDDDETGLLIEEDETGLLVEEDPETSLLEADVQMRFNPNLIRMSNGEKVEIDKPVFRVGKEKSYVDYFVNNNSAVSRIHADIISKNNSFFVFDNNSTNGTYINGLIIDEKKETEIFDGDELKLANEKFTFHTM